MSANLDVTIKFPNPNIPEKEKDEGYHKKYVQAIANRTLDSSFDIVYNVMNESYEYYNGTQISDEFQFLQQAEDGDVLPAKWINFNSIKTKIDLQISEVASRGYEIKVNALNKDAIDRKTEEKERMRTEMRLKSVLQELENQFGLPVVGSQYIPESEQELDEYFDKKYKLKNEIIMEKALKPIAKQNDWDFRMMQLYRDLLITGRCFTRNDIVNGKVVARRVDPRRMVYDFDAEDDFLTDATYFGEVYYLPIYEAAEIYGLTKEEVSQLYESSKNQNYIASLHEGKRIQRLFENAAVRFFRRDKGQLRVLVLNAVWHDMKPNKYKESNDKYGNTHIKSIDDDENKKDAKSSPIQIWRKGTLIGGIMMKDWGVMENMTRDSENPYETHPPYTALIPNYVNYQGISTVDQLKQLQDYKNILMYNMQLEVNKAGGKGFVYDIAQLPDEWDFHTMLKYLKTTNVTVIDSSQATGQYNQFGPIDQTFSENVERYLRLVQFVDDQIDQIAGVNEAREGIQQGASQKVGVTNAMLARSNMITEGRVRLFYQFCSKVFTQLGRLLKVVALEDREQFIKLIGDAAVDFLNSNMDFDLDDYGIYIRMMPKSLDDENEFKQYVMAALQAGQIDFVNAFRIIQEEDKQYALNQFEKIIKENIQRAEQAQQQAQQFELQKQQQKNESDNQRLAAQYQGQAQLANQTESLKHMNNKEMESLKGQIQTIIDKNRELERRITELSKVNVSKTDNLA